MVWSSKSRRRVLTKVARPQQFGLQIESLEARQVFSVDCAIAPEILPETIQEPAAEIAAFDASQAATTANSDGAGNSFATARDLGVLRGTQTVQDFAGSSDQYDYYKFTLQGETEVSLTLGDLQGDLDFYLYDSNQQLLGSSYKGGTSTESIESTLSAGDYYLLVTPYQANSTYTVTLSGESQETATPPDLAGNSIQNARDIGTLDGQQQYQDWVGQADANDYYRFDIDETSDVTITLSNMQDDANLYLYDANGTRLARSYTPGTAADESIEITLEAGTYYARVLRNSSANTDYLLTLDSEAVDTDGAGNSMQDARDVGELDGRQQFNDWVGTTDSEDYYRFELETRGEVNLELTGLSGDVDLYLYDANGNRVARSWNGGNSDETIAATLDAGTYYVRVVPYQSTESTYHLSMEATLLGDPTPDPDPTPVPDPGNDPFPNVPYYGDGDDWNLNAINAPEAWEQGYTGEGIVVAVLDTGVDYNHTDLNANIWVNSGEIAGDGIDNDSNGYVDDIRGWNFDADNNNPMDRDGHGTHVAGTIAGEKNSFGVTGVAYNAEIMSVKVLGDDGSGTYTAIAAGIRYAVDNGAHVINMSLGGGYSSAIDAALQYAGQNGVFVVIASGNESASVPSYPARHANEYTHVLSVGAHDSSSDLADFSNRVGNSAAVQVDAPGVNIYSSVPNRSYARFNGTSMATPHVAGLAALALSANPNLSPAELRNLIVDGADRQIDGSDSIGGINAANTVAWAVGFQGTAGTSSASVTPANPGYQSFWYSLYSSSYTASSAQAAVPDFSVDVLRTYSAVTPTAETVANPISPIQANAEETNLVQNGEYNREWLFSDQHNIDALFTNSQRQANANPTPAHVASALDRAFADTYQVAGTLVGQS